MYIQMYRETTSMGIFISSCVMVHGSLDLSPKPSVEGGVTIEEWKQFYIQTPYIYKHAIGLRVNQDIILLRGCCARINQPFTPPPTCISHPGAVLSRDYWEVYDSPSNSRLYAIDHTVLVMTTSCKGQVRFSPVAYIDRDISDIHGCIKK